jgi:hypothetical protein
VNHVLEDASAASVTGRRAHRKVGIGELGPDAEDLHAFCGIAVDQKVVSHCRLRTSFEYGRRGDITIAIDFSNDARPYADETAEAVMLLLLRSGIHPLAVNT